MKGGECRERAYRLVSRRFSQAFLSFFTASHILDAPDRFFSYTFQSATVKLTTPGGVFRNGFGRPSQ